jgi:beta-lactamase regulating signal transducer with metallopeptidase domain
MNLIPDTILRAVCWTLLHSLWQGLALAVAAGIVMLLSKKAGAALRYNLLCWLMILFIIVSGYTFYRQLYTPVSAAPSITNLAAGAGISPVDGKAPLTGTPDTGASALRDSIASFIQYFNAHASLVVVTWFILFLARFVKVLSGLVYVQRIRHYQTSPAPADWELRLTQLLEKLQIKVRVSLLESALVKVPVVVGILKPVILVPVGMLARLSPQQVESILIHELAHILRRDYLFNLLQNLVDTLFFFNPALLWVSSLIRGERENCCDDIAIGETKSRKQFVEALVSFHEYTQSVQGYALSFAGKENHVLRRVKRIVYKKNHTLNPGERVLLMGGLLVLSAAFITINGGRPAGPRAFRPPVTPTATAVRPAPAATTTLSSALGTALASVTTTTPSSAPARPSILPAAIKTPRVLPPASGKDTIIKPAHIRNGNEQDLYEQLQELGYHKISLDELDECLTHGVNADFIAAFQKIGYTDLSLERATQLRDHGVNADFISGYKNIGLGQAQELRDHGVSPSFINRFKEQGYSQITLEKAQELRDHGVTIDFIEEIRQLGFKDISLDIATELIDHGVTSNFISEWKKKTGSLLELRDYIRLRDNGISPS